MGTIKESHTQWIPLKLWFLDQLKERKVKKIYETVNEINSICAEMPVLGSSIKAIEQQEVKFNRQGKFRHWFKELHRVSTKPDNTLILEQLWSKVLQYTHSSVKELGGKFSHSSKSSFNASEHFIALLKGTSLKVIYSPSCTDKCDFTLDLSGNFKVTDFSWSRSCQSSLSLITHKQTVRLTNVFLGEFSYDACSSTSLCCIKGSEYDPDQLMTSGHKLTLWDVRQEGPASISCDIRSSCSSLGKHISKSSCFIETDVFSCVLAGSEGQLHMLDKRNLSEVVSVVDTRFRHIFSVEMSQTKGSIVLQSVNGIVKVCNNSTLKTMESGYSSQAQAYPSNGRIFGDDHFLQFSEKLLLFYELFRLPVLDVQLPEQTRVLSSAFSNKPDKLFCSGISNAVLISFY